MALIPLAQYARARGKDLANARHAAIRGVFNTARKMGRDWVIDEEEPYPDRRVKTGKYRDARKVADVVDGHIDPR